MLNASIVSLISLTKGITDRRNLLDEHRDIKSQYIKIAEETMEGYSEYVSSSNNAVEDIDILMSVLSLFHAKSYPALLLDEGIFTVLDKFVERGWIKIDKS